MRHTAVLVVVLGCGGKTAPAPARDGTLSFEVRDTQGNLIPARITLVGVGDTPEPKLAVGDAGERRGSLQITSNKIMSLDGTGEVAVPDGIYDIYVSRGIEWSLSVTPRVVLGRKGYALAAKLDRVIDTTGWVSADFHVHASPSWDSHVPQASRVIEFVVEGMDMIVSTDHNVVADYAPAIAELGADKLLASMIGDELTTYGWGHFGVYPLPAKLVGQRYGASWRHLTEGRAIMTQVREDHPTTLIQVNHPRTYGGMGYFKDERFDRLHATSTHHGFSLEFDALEVMNGSDSSQMENVLLDWYSLIDHGRTVTATGNSDTHHLGVTLAGYPRNYLRVPDDRAGKFGDADIVKALRGHHAFFTTGPFVELTVGDAGIGDLVPAAQGKVTVRITVFAAPWIDVDSCVLLVNGREAQRWAIPPATVPTRLEVTHEVQVTADSYITLRVAGDAPMWPVAGDAEHAQVVPLAITNPIFIDANGDGIWSAPAR